jgi:predicted HicB family RNase H-like nuclease
MNHQANLKQRQTKTSRYDSGRQIHIRLSEELHRRLRISAAEEDVTIQQWVGRLIEQALDGK